MRSLWRSLRNWVWCRTGCVELRRTEVVEHEREIAEAEARAAET
jgi:hypothetical protein